jgi:hypothetical protein
VNDEQSLIGIDDVNHLEEPISDSASDHLPLLIAYASRIGPAGAADDVLGFLD